MEELSLPHLYQDTTQAISGSIQQTSGIAPKRSGWCGPNSSSASQSRQRQPAQLTEYFHALFSILFVCSLFSSHISGECMMNMSDFSTDV